MCGRFALAHPKETLEHWFSVSALPKLDPAYNIAPSSKILTIRDGKDDKSSRVGSLMRWGLVPPWAADASKLPIMNNARGETVSEKPMFKQAFLKRRCLIPISGFYEWQVIPGQKTKQPYYISFKDETPMALAGIWETSQLPDADTGKFLDTCTILTISANALVAPIHDRMPVILGRDDWQTWLSPEDVSLSQLRSLIRPFEAEPMQAWCVSSEVNRVANNSPELIKVMLL